MMSPEVITYNESLDPQNQEIADKLYNIISQNIEAENKVWHAHPVWFINGNPIVGYSKLKNCMRLLFWSGQSFDEPGLANEGKFKAAEVRYTSAAEINEEDLKRWLHKAKTIQWDYKNLIKRKGKLEPLA